ncbi:hypothetical protein ACIRLA_46235 [Streptomyces sp. NPDC102364]|uniref:hypothetical protein n=1 Tax=Streptomyces sp. NPDC102364 TaxID=3366161 RepID=UPI0038005EA4
MNQNHPPVFVVIHPDGTVAWGADLQAAKSAMGPYGTDSGFAGHPEISRLRLMMSDVALVMRDEFPTNVPAGRVLETLTGVRPSDSIQELRGPVALYYYDPTNMWDSSRPMTADEQRAMDEALATAGCNR